MRIATALALSLLVAAAPARAQDQDPHRSEPRAAGVDTDSLTSATASAEARGRAPEEGRGAGAAENVDIITPHITDSRHFDYPCFKSGLVCELELPQWPLLHVGKYAIDVSPTKHVVWMLIAAAVCVAVLVGAAASHRRHSERGGAPRGFPGAIEALVLYLRNEVVLPNVGPHGDKYVPFVLSLFFFILFANLFGLIPYGSTATGNISVTATLALITFVMVEVAGMRALGRDYIGTIVYWPHDMPLLMKLPMTFIMTPVEIVGKFTKPFALAIRLFANMTAGHVVMLALIGLIFTFGSYLVALAPVAMGVAVMLLELFVAFLQAFIFSLLASVFIGQIRTAHH